MPLCSSKANMLLSCFVSLLKIAVYAKKISTLAGQENAFLRCLCNGAFPTETNAPCARPL
ncbi:hypothetical protein ABEB36_010024 [Hypothenemus hampei]|uniref:Uncharacterized protein n=1 Tax=Hypothenemus hampei TaxID=57062 RepID=A0ABD1EL81_HYPHA